MHAGRESSAARQSGGTRERGRSPPLQAARRPPAHALRARAPCRKLCLASREARVRACSRARWRDRALRFALRSVAWISKGSRANVPNQSPESHMHACRLWGLLCVPAPSVFWFILRGTMVDPLDTQDGHARKRLDAGVLSLPRIFAKQRDVARCRG